MRLTLVIVFGPDTDVQLPGESPDNICLAPSGGLMVCEDGNGAQHVYGVTRGGEVYAMARGRQNIGTPEQPEWGEFAGCHLLPGRPDDVRQLLHAGNDVRGDGSLAPIGGCKGRHRLR